MRPPSTFAPVVPTPDVPPDDDHLWRSIEVKIGEPVYKKMPASEVCLHMRVTDRWMAVVVLEGGRMAQLYDQAGQMFSGPITVGEAGIFRREDGTFYCYPNIG